jgi:cysteine synthase A
MDQFTYAERATDWRGNNNIAESIFAQMRASRTPCRAGWWCSAGTGGTSATLGSLRALPGTTPLCVVDPERSVFFDYYLTARPT